MRLHEIAALPSPPGPWSEGGKIPWHEPAFSRRMLAEHLTQAHDLASRRLPIVDRQVQWIDGLLGSAPSRILDLACGPGLYASRLARLGHSCVGIDFSPASIEHAAAEAGREGLACEYRLEDLLKADFGGDFHLAMLIYGELNVFRPEEVRKLLRKARAALVPDGLLLLELSPFEAVRGRAGRGPSWSTHREGLFSDRPHLLLEEAFWDEEAAVATTRWLVVDLETSEVELHSESQQAWEEGRFREMLDECGFAEVRTVSGEIDLVMWLGRSKE